MLLSEARTKVLRLVDDDGTRFNTDSLNTEIDDALLTAQQETWQAAVAAGSSIFVIEAAISSNAAGVVDLTAIKPIEVVNLSLSYSGQRLVIPPCRFDEAPTNAAGVRNLAIAYVARSAFPSAPANPFVWGHANITATSLLDKLMCAIAASELKIKDAEVNAALEKRKEELRAAVIETLSIPSWSVLPLDGFCSDGTNSGFAYLMTAPDALQLVLA